MDDKVYTPVVVSDAPFPTQPQQPQAATSPSSNGVYTHQQIPDTPMPTKMIAQELINNALNTKNRKILAEFQFTKTGAIQIGDFEEGQHGDVRISPDGITARNVNGETTFALDGDTGDAIFKGTVQAGDFVVIDDIGLVSLSSFRNGNISYRFGRSIGYTGAVTEAIPNTSISFFLPRSANVFIIFTTNVHMASMLSGYSPIIDFYLEIDGEGDSLFAGEIQDCQQGADAAASNVHRSRVSAFTFQDLFTLAEGNHTINMRWDFDYTPPDVGIEAWVDHSSLTYLVLGT